MNSKITIEEEIENEIQEKRRIPKEVSQEIIKKIFINLLKAIAIMFIFLLINFTYMNIEQSKLLNYMKLISGVFLIGGLLTIEIAYKKDSGQLAITSIELLVLAFYILSIVHITTLLKYDFKFYVLTFSYIFGIYYLLKCIIIYTKERKKYLDSLSDISDIVKEEEPIKKEAKKRRNNEKVKKEGKSSRETKIKSEKGQSKKSAKTVKTKKAPSKTKTTKTGAKKKTTKKEESKTTKKITKKEVKIND